MSSANNAQALSSAKINVKVPRGELALRWALLHLFL
jgi:hypothetical protein